MPTCAVVICSMAVVEMKKTHEDEDQGTKGGRFFLPAQKAQESDEEITDYEKKRMENIAEKKAMFEDKLRNAKFAVRAKPFKCSKCLSEFMKKAQLKRHQCIKCDLCNKYLKNSQSFYNHDRVEHDGHFAMKSKLKRPERKKKNVSRYDPDEFEEKNDDHNLNHHTSQSSL